MNKEAIQKIWFEEFNSHKFSCESSTSLDKDKSGGQQKQKQLMSLILEIHLRNESRALQPHLQLKVDISP